MNSFYQYTYFYTRDILSLHIKILNYYFIFVFTFCVVLLKIKKNHGRNAMESIKLPWLRTIKTNVCTKNDGVDVKNALRKK